MVDLSAVGAIGASGPVLAVLGYAGVRLIDRVCFLVGLRMILRSTSGNTRQAVLAAYLERNGAKTEVTGRRSRTP
jgi:hypothetical protein